LEGAARGALTGSFDPKVLAPGEEVVTPHLKWLKPGAERPLKALFVMSQHCMREVVELGQRLELDYELFVIPSRPPPAAFNTPPLTRQDFRRDLQEKLAAPNDLIVVGVQSWQHLTLWQRYRILKKVKDGTPLVSLRKSADEYLRRATAKERITVEAPFLFPFKGLPAFAEYADSATFWKETASFFKFGAGTIALLNHIPVTPPQAFTPQRPKGLELHMLEYDYYQALVVHLLRTAAGAAPRVRVTGRDHWQVDREELPAVEFNLVAQKPERLLCRFTLRDRDNRVLRSEERRVRLAPGENACLFLTGRPPAGDCFADLWVLDRGRVVDFGSAFVEVRSENAITALQAPEHVRKNEPVAGKVALALQPGAQGLTLNVVQRDNLGRVTARQTIPVPRADSAAMEVPFRLPPTQPVAIVQHLEVELRRGVELLARKAAPFSISDLHPPSDEFRYVIWGVGECGAHTYLAYHAYTQLRDAGFDTHYTGFHELVPLADMHHIPYATRLQPDEAAGKKAKGRDVYTRTPCLSDPKHRQELGAHLTGVAERVKPFSTTEFSMGDECHFCYGAQRELCFSPTCVAAFHDFLKREYGTIAAVNREYGAGYGSFAEVQPITLSEAKKTPNLGPLWVDYRRHMENTWAGIQKVCRDAIRKVIPNARVGYEGTDYDNINSFDAFEFDKVMQVMRLNNTYDGVFAPYAVVDLSEPNTMLGTGWIGSYADYKKHDHWPSQAFNRYISWRHLFRGANSIWVWYACAADRGVGHGSVMAPDFSFFECFAPNLTETARIKSGPGKLLMHAQRESDGVAILYSPSSIHAATLCGMSGLQQDVLRSLVPLFEDTRRQFHIISYRELAAGTLRKQGFRFLFLPFAQALSPEEAANVAAFVRNGGTVMADLRPGVCDQHGKAHDKGVLDEVFGVTQQTGARALEEAAIRFDDPALPAGLPKTYADAQLHTTTGQAAARAGDAPALISNAYGKGKAVLWNFSLHAYQRNAGVLSIEVERLREQAPEIKALFEALLRIAGGEPQLTVTPDVHGLRAYRFRAGDLRYLGLLQHPCRAQAAAGIDDDRTAPTPTSTSIGLGAEYHVTDVRSGRSLGRTNRVNFLVKPGEAALYSLLPYAVEGLELRAPSGLRQGEELEYVVSLDTAGASPGLHIVRAELRAPDGRPAPHYARNLTVRNGQCVTRLPLALNETPGKWRLLVKDVASGRTAEKTIKVKQTP